MHPLDLVRPKAGAALVLMGTAQEVLMGGSGDTEERMSFCWPRPLRRLHDAFDGLTVWCQGILRSQVEGQTLGCRPCGYGGFVGGGCPGH